MNLLNPLFFFLNFVLFNHAIAAYECETFTAEDYEEAEALFIQHHTKIPGVTALHIAAATGDLEGIKKALAGGIHINALDSRRFTAAHFAALREDKAAFNFLKEKGAKLKLRNKWQLGAGDYLNVVNLQDPGSQHINVWDEDSNGVVQIDGNQFCKRFGATFVNGIKLRPQTAMRIWIKETLGEDGIGMGLRKVNLEVGSRTTPYTDLYIKKISDKNGNNLGFGLFANRDFAPGEVLSLYEGEWAFEGHNSEYQLDKIDATKLRGYLGFSADGAPNAVVSGFSAGLGVPKASYAMAVRRIKKGEAIMWDYGHHDIKWEMYSELDSAKVEAYLGNMKISEWAKDPEAQIAHESVSGLAKLSIFSYIGNTPVVFVRLALEGVIDAEDMKLMYQVQMTISQLSQDAFRLFLKGVELVKKSSEARQFLLEKAEEGNATILINTLIFVGQIGETVTREIIMERWHSVQEQICATLVDESGRRGGCYLLKKSKDEL